MNCPRRRTEEIECQDLGDELLVSDLRADRVHQLNPTMAEIWRLCDGTRTSEQIAGALAERFDASEVSDLPRIARESLEQLTALDLLLHDVDPKKSEQT